MIEGIGMAGLRRKRVSSWLPTRKGRRMTLSPRGLAFLLRQEGLSEEAYIDIVGVWTIGVGHTAAAGPPAPHKGMRISRQAAIRLFLTDVRVYERAVRRALRNREVPQHVFDALVSFHYNTGKISRASFLPYLLRGDIEEAKRRFMWWRRPAGVVPRRKEEFALLFDEDYGPLDRGTLWAPGGDYRPRPAGTFNPLVEVEKALHRGSGAQASEETIRRVQRALRRAGYAEVGAADGIYGPRTRAALNAWLLDHGMAPAERLHDVPASVLDDLIRDPGRRPEHPDREMATAADLRRAGSTDIRRSDWGLAGGTGLAMLGAVGEAARRVSDSLESIASPIRLFLGNNAFVIMIAAGVAGGVLIWSWRRNRVRRHREGSYVSR